MPAVTLNGTPFAGTVYDADSVLRAPRMPTEKPDKIGPVLISEAGSRTKIVFATKTSWAIEWKRVPEATRAAVRAIWGLTTTFSFLHPNGTTYTVQCEEAADYVAVCDEAATLPNGTRYYDITLTVHQP